MSAPSEVWSDGDDVARHDLGSEECGTFEYDKEKDDAQCNKCGEWLGKNELYEIARVNY